MSRFQLPEHHNRRVMRTIGARTTATATATATPTTASTTATTPGSTVTVRQQYIYKSKEDPDRNIVFGNRNSGRRQDLGGRQEMMGRQEIMGRQEVGGRQEVVGRQEGVGRRHSHRSTDAFAGEDEYIPSSTEIDGRPKTSHGRRRPHHAPGRHRIEREFTGVDLFEDKSQSRDIDIPLRDVTTPVRAEPVRSTSVLKYAHPLPNIESVPIATAPANLPATKPTKSDVMKEPQVLVIADAAKTTEIGSEPEVDLSPQPKYQPVQLPSEPDGAEVRLLLAIKMPSGERVQRYFRQTETLLVVLQFAEFMAHRNFDQHVFVGAAPRKVYGDMTVKLSETDLKDRTVLFLQSR